MLRFRKRIREQQDFILFTIFLYFGAFLLVNSISEIRRQSALLLALPAALSVGMVYAWLLARLGRKQNPVRTNSHPTLGLVRVFPDRWKTTLTGHPFGEGIELSGESEQTPPTAAQVELFDDITERFVSIREAAFKALMVDLQASTPPFKTEELKLESIWLGKDSFSFYFGVPSRRAQAHDGFYVDFRDFQVEEAGWVH